MQFPACSDREAEMVQRNNGPTRSFPHGMSSRRLALAVVALVAVASADCASGKVSHLTCESDLGVVGGAFDAGVSVGADVANIGESGSIRVVATLTTSEGEWQRAQTLDFAKGTS